MQSETTGRLGNKLSRFHAIMRELERAVLLEELVATGFNLCQAARKLGIHRNTLLRRCHVCDLNVAQLRKFPNRDEALAERIRFNSQEKMRRMA